MSDYVLKWKDTDVLHFNTRINSVRVLNSRLLPLGISNMKASYSMITKFCSDRILMLNRVYCKEILTSCGIDDQSDVNIRLTGKGLSFRDNYWIDLENSNKTWGSFNLFENRIARVSITGDSDYVKIGDEFFTGELTNKGTRAKCYYRYNNNLFLFKQETDKEICAEIASYYIASAIGVRSSRYFVSDLFGKNCSVCQILTSSDFELIPYRDILSAYGDNAYNFVMSIDSVNFALMQIFDYITLNTDRNRDNHGLLRYKGNYSSLYPLFDHDSCFKGKGTNAVYFPTGMTFSKTLDYLKTLPVYSKLNIKQIKLNLRSPKLRDILLRYISYDDYNSMQKRVDNL